MEWDLQGVEREALGRGIGRGQGGGIMMRRGKRRGLLSSEVYCIGPFAALSVVAFICLSSMMLFPFCFFRFDGTCILLESCLIIFGYFPLCFPRAVLAGPFLAKHFRFEATPPTCRSTYSPLHLLTALSFSVNSYSEIHACGHHFCLRFRPLFITSFTHYSSRC